MHGNFPISFLICFQVSRKILMEKKIGEKGPRCYHMLSEIFKNPFCKTISQQ